MAGIARATKKTVFEKMKIEEIQAQLDLINEYKKAIKENEAGIKWITDRPKAFIKTIVFGSGAEGDPDMTLRFNECGANFLVGEVLEVLTRHNDGQCARLNELIIKLEGKV